MGEKKRRKRAAAVRAGLGIDPLRPVTFRTLEVDFDERTINIDGRVIPITTRVVSLPILSGDAVFVPRGSMERIA